MKNTDNTPKEADKSPHSNLPEGMTDGDNKGLDSGIGFSDLAYYNVLMKGGRVTRGTIRKEEPQQEEKKVIKKSAAKRKKLTKALDDTVLEQDDERLENLPTPVLNKF